LARLALRSINADAVLRFALMVSRASSRCAKYALSTSAIGSPTMRSNNPAIHLNSSFILKTASAQRAPQDAVKT
jgi:hypothetical protein